MKTLLEQEIAQLREVLSAVLTMPEHDGTQDTSKIRIDIKRRARALLNQEPNTGRETRA